MESKFLTGRFWVVLMLAIVLGGLAFIFSYDPEVGALIFTAVFIAWYSLETSKLVKETNVANKLSSIIRREMMMANQLSIQPGLILEYQR